MLGKIIKFPDFFLFTVVNMKRFFYFEKTLKISITLLLITIQTASSKKWKTNRDSIIIDALYQEEENMLKGRIEKGSCITDHKDHGICMSLRECSPVLFSSDGTVRNEDVATMYSQVVSNCTKYDFESKEKSSEKFMQLQEFEKAKIGDIVVCCPHENSNYSERSWFENVEYDLYQTTESESVVVSTLVDDLVVGDEDAEGDATLSPQEISIIDAKDEVRNSTVHDVNIEQVITESDIIEDYENLLINQTEAPNQDDRFEETQKENDPNKIGDNNMKPEDADVIEQIRHAEQENQIADTVCPAVTAYDSRPFFKSYPWLAAILTRRKTGPLCAASLIDSKHILTAAHCLHRFNSKDVAGMKIRLGFSKLSQNDTFDDYHVERRASKIIYHKRFHLQSKMDNNIALVQLDEPVEFNERISPIRIFDGAIGFDVGSCIGTESGWIKPGNKRVTSISDGVIHFIAPPIGPFHLKESITRIYSNVECRNELHSEITQEMICAKAENLEAEGPISHFKGNDGGPLIIKTGKIIQQVGIKSWAYQGDQFPTVYTRVSSYLDWIRNNLDM